jgi:hypothetical protein
VRLDREEVDEEEEEEEEEEEKEEGRCAMERPGGWDAVGNEDAETAVAALLLDGGKLSVAGTLVGEEGSDTSGEGRGWEDVCALDWCILRPAEPIKCLYDPVVL